MDAMAAIATLQQKILDDKDMSETEKLPIILAIGLVGEVINELKLIRSHLDEARDIYNGRFR